MIQAGKTKANNRALASLSKVILLGASANESKISFINFFFILFQTSLFLIRLYLLKIEKL